MAGRSRDLIVKFIGEDRASRVVDHVGDSVEKAGKKADTAGDRISRGFGSKVDDLARSIPGGSTVIDGLGLDFETMGSKSLLAGGLVAGAGVAAFTSIKMFSDLALEVGRFSDAAGISADAASRWIEVTGDLGMDAGIVEDAFRKMEVAAGKTPAKFDEFGVSIARAKDGSVDANATFLNVIDRLREIKDPTERAAAAQGLLGRSWTDLAEVINDPNLRKNLDAVSGAKIIDEGEVQQARDLRAALDTLKDTGENLALSLGQAIIPGVTDLAEAVGFVTDALNAVPGGISGMQSALSWFTPTGQGGKVVDGLKGMRDGFHDLTTEDVNGVVGETIVKFDALQVSADNLARAGLYVTAKDAENAREALADLGTETDDTKRSTDNLKSALDLLKGSLSIEQAALSAESAIARLGEEGGFTRDNVLSAKDALVNFGSSLDQFTTDEQRRRIAVLVDSGQLAEAQQYIKNIADGIWALNHTPVVIRSSVVPGRNVVDGGRASGGFVSPGGTYLVGERGPEVLQMGGRGGTVIPNHQLPIGGAGPSVTINVNAAVVDERALGRAVEQARAAFARAGGRLVA